MSSKTTCPRCGQQATVTYTARETARIHTHKCAHGRHCLASGYDCPDCAAIVFHVEPADRTVGIMSESFWAARTAATCWVELHEYGPTLETSTLVWMNDGEPCGRPVDGDSVERFLFDHVEAYYKAQDRGDAQAEEAD